MKDNILYIMCGVPGSGKSTWAEAHQTELNSHRISRDTVRFSLISERDEYFAKETTVFNQFTTLISQLLNSNVSAIADATHLTKNSRQKLINKIKEQVKNMPKIVAIYMDIPIEVAIERNNKRKDRQHVPETVIKNMYDSIIVPTIEEDDIDEVWIINEEGVRTNAE